MMIWYFILQSGHTTGSLNEKKIRAMAGIRRVYCCDISEFKGQLLGLSGMAEMLHLFIQCLYNWIHGFKPKTGAETWLARQGMYENNQYPKGSQRRG